ncbi:YidC/Oxa1 family membrane protein insertase [Tissierella creatinophila]|uniref:Membrane protein insertase MisCA n=1 Tax=Tissierella creatinophila DSM 6911 TaxID=1123403 RepID=A0A1U7M610_TISCR|nr:YidC/Oxa1 family membrane protein insertase [Tissierella creatinophila]OLS02715.1 membrane protein insertase MisCA precursor [Tissierella creatinophila DSM 6911]
MTAFLGKILGSLLRYVYDIISTVGSEPGNFSYYAMAVIVTTIIFKLMLLPINFQQTKSTRIMGEIQPKMKVIQDKYKKDPQTMQVKMQELYKEYNYNPASGCLPLLIQFPIIIAFFAVFREPAKYAFTEPGLYDKISKVFLWIPNLDNPDPFLWGLPLLAAATTYLQSKLMTPPPASGNANDPAQSTQKMMTIFLPFLIFFSAKSFPAGLALYWVLGNVFTIIQQLISNRSSIKAREE